MLFGNPQHQIQNFRPIGPVVWEIWPGPNFESFGKNGHGCQPLNPHISGTSDPIFIKLVLMDRQFDNDSKYVIRVQIGECFGALTF